jgi:hypothetical protein
LIPTATAALAADVRMLVIILGLSGDVDFLCTRVISFSRVW